MQELFLWHPALLIALQQALHFVVVEVTLVIGNGTSGLQCTIKLTNSIIGTRSGGLWLVGFFVGIVVVIVDFLVVIIVAVIVLSDGSVGVNLA